MDPRTVPAIRSLFRDFDAVAPGRSRASDGTVGDRPHQQHPSGHNPDDTPGSRPENEDPDHEPEIRAGDITTDLRTPGLTMAACVRHVVERCRTGKETRLLYVIFDRTYYAAEHGWRPVRYLGSDPHTGHSHWSIRPTEAAENGTQSWGLDELGDDVSFQEKLGETSSTKSRFGAGAKTAETYVKLGAIYAYDAAKTAGAAVTAITALKAVVDQLAAVIRAGGGSVDTAAILSGVDSRLSALRAELPEATADAFGERLAADQGVAS